MAAGLGITGNDTNRFAAWSAQWNETSTMAGFTAAWAKGMQAGLVTSHALGHYAIDHDAYGPKARKCLKSALTLFAVAPTSRTSSSL